MGRANWEPTTVKEMKTILINNFEFRNELDQNVAAALEKTIRNFLPCDSHSVSFLLKSYGANFRLDFKVGGADVNCGRVNVVTDGKGTVTNIYCG